MLEMRKSGDRGVGKLDWLSARFTFSFGPYKDPKQVGFSDLQLLNDDRVEPAGGKLVDVRAFDSIEHGQFLVSASTTDANLVPSP